MNVIKIDANDFEGALSEIVGRLQRGEVLILPTDTVYGLVCDAANESAVGKIFKIKNRDLSNPLPVFVEDIKMAEDYAFIDLAQKEFLKNNWPGATTVILKAKPGLSKLVYKNDTIGLRQSSHELISSVMGRFKRPLAQTSANISGQGALTSIKKVLGQFEGAEVQPDAVVDAGDLSKNEPSKIVDYSDSKIKTIRK